MRRALIIAALFCLGFTFTKDPNMTYFRSLFKEVTFDPTDTLHFGPDEYRSGSQDSGGTSFMEIVLQNGNTSTQTVEYSNGNFFLPLIRGQMNGQEVFIVEYGDTNDIAIYAGKVVTLYVYNKGFRKSLEIAWEEAGEGPWYEMDGWILDLNHDGKMDILTREIGESPGYYEVNGVDTFDIREVDNLNAYSLVDTGFVMMDVPNPDSLRNIYKNHHAEY